MSNDVYTCAKCKQIKLKTEFSRCSKSKQGVISRCKLCRRQDYLDTYDKYRDQRRSHYKEYYLKNWEKKSQYGKKYNREHREHRNQLKRAWRKKHPLDYKRTVINGNAVKYHATDHIRLWEIENLWDAQDAVCPFTGCSLTPQTAVLMYIIHPENGGLHRINNLVFATRQVHMHKANLSIEELCSRAGLDFEAVATRIKAIHSKHAELSQK